MALLLISPEPVQGQNKTSVSFTIQQGPNLSVIIQWTRPGEDSFDYALERSADERTWQRIANMNSQLSPYYDYVDLQRASGTNYYRIVQRKREELVAVSDTKCIQVGNADRLYIWPTPANDILHIQSPFINGTIDIIDSYGRFIRKIAVTDPITGVPLQALPGGMYFIHLRHGKDILVEKFIKQEGL
jgi:hypothetical protein